MNDIKASLVSGMLAAGLLFGCLFSAIRHELQAIKPILVYGNLLPGSSVTNLEGLGILLAGIVLSVSFGALVLIRYCGRRSSGAMLHETNLNAARGMVGLEELKER